MWAQIINAVLGIWLMCAPAILDYADPAKDHDRIVGPIAAAFAIIAWWEATRSLRWLNLVIGVWLLLAPWALGYVHREAIVNSLLVGVMLAVFSLFRGKITQQFGGGWSVLFKSGQGERGDAEEAGS